MSALPAKASEAAAVVRFLVERKGFDRKAANVIYRRFLTLVAAASIGDGLDGLSDRQRCELMAATHLAEADVSDNAWGAIRTEWDVAVAEYEMARVAA